MMKWLMCVAFLILNVQAICQDSLRGSRIVAEGTHVMLSYEQPAVTEHQIFGGSVPFGKIWSAGGKNATQIRFEKDSNFGGLPVKAGTYTMLVIPEKKEWTFILNAVVKDGIFNYQQNRDKDVLKITVPVRKIENKVEALTYRFSDTQMIVEWEHTQVVVRVN